MSDKPISPLRRRMIDDMTARRFSEDTQRGLRSDARIVGDRFRQPIERELLAAILAEEPDRVGAALPAMPHQLGAALEPVLQRLELRRRRSALPGQAVMGSVGGVGDQRHLHCAGRRRSRSG